MAVSKTLRYEIFRRDNHACRYCGSMAPDVKLTVDHVVPVALGGSDEPTNLVTACGDCNAGKSATPTDAPLVEDIAQDALRWQRAIQAANEIAARERSATDAFVAFFEERWNAWGWDGTDGERHRFPLPPGWHERIREFALAGVPGTDLDDSISIAMGTSPVDNRFAYFIGVVRRKQSVRASVASELIRQGLVQVAMMLHCDGCDITTADTRAGWLRLHRRGALSATAAAMFGRNSSDQPDPDAVLGADGLLFHDYDCLRIWLIASGAA